MKLLFILVALVSSLCTTPLYAGSFSTPSGGGNVVGPSSSTDNAVVLHDGVDGKLVKDSTVTVDPSGNLGVIGDISLTGSLVRALNIGDGVITVSTTGPDQGRVNATGFLHLRVGSVDKLNLNPGSVVVNEAGADVDFRVESDTSTNALFVEGSTGRVGIQNGASTPQYRLDVGENSYFAINGNFAHIMQHNNAALTFWSIAPRNGGDFDIAVTTVDPRPSSGTISTTGNAISIKANKDVEFLGNIISNASIIMEDTDAAGCTEITTLDGVISGAIVTCP